MTAPHINSVSNINRSFKFTCLPHQKELDLPCYISTFGFTKQELKVNLEISAKCFLVYSLNGCGRAYIEGRWEKVPEGSLLYIPSHSQIKYEPIDENAWSTVYITFSGKFAESMLPRKTCVIDGDHSYMYDIVTFLCEKYNQEDFYEYSSSKLYFILLKLQRLTNSADNITIFKGDPRGQVFRSIKYITEHFTQDLPVSFLAETCKISEEYYCRLFKKTVGTTPLSYINSLRINRACDMLKKHPDSKIEDIAKDCGFNNISYFNRVFKNETGLTPGMFRANADFKNE